MGGICRRSWTINCPQPHTYDRNILNYWHSNWWEHGPYPARLSAHSNWSRIWLLKYIAQLHELEGVWLCNPLELYESSLSCMPQWFQIIQESQWASAYGQWYIPDAGSVWCSHWRRMDSLPWLWHLGQYVISFSVRGSCNKTFPLT